MALYCVRFPFIYIRLETTKFSQVAIESYFVALANAKVILHSSASWGLESMGSYFTFSMYFYLPSTNTHKKQSTQTHYFMHDVRLLPERGTRIEIQLE